jgi:hypothetical protein
MNSTREKCSVSNAVRLRVQLGVLGATVVSNLLRIVTPAFVGVAQSQVRLLICYAQSTPHTTLAVLGNGSQNGALSSHSGRRRVASPSCLLVN